MERTNSTPEIKFVSYSGKAPSLCIGNLVLLIDGKERKIPSYTSFWESGGRCYEKLGITDEKPWKIIPEDMPKDLRPFAKEIEEIFNQNVPFGCCGGCL